MEYFDIVDENGIHIGKIKPRKDVHNDGDWHCSVHIWIVNSNNEILLQKRSPNKDSYPNKWDISCAGHIPSGYNSIESAIKELEEELGLFLQPSDLELIFTQKHKGNRDDPNFIDNEFNDVYLITLNLDISKLTLQKEELTEVKYFDLIKLKKLVDEENPEIVLIKEEFNRLYNILLNKKT